MTLKTLSQVAAKYDLDLSKVEREGYCELLFDDKYLIRLSVDEYSITLKSTIIKLSNDKYLRYKQTKAALKSSLALLTTTLAALFLETEQGNNCSKDQLTGGALCLVRLLDGRDMPSFEVVDEIEKFLMALEVYDKQIPKY